MKAVLSVLLIALLMFGSALSAQEATPEVTPEAETPIFDQALVDLMLSLKPTRGEDGAFILGSPDAPVTIIEFTDFACPFCQRYHPTVQAFIEQFVATGMARFEYRTLPTAGGRLTAFASLFAECVDDAIPGAFWLAHEYYYGVAELGLYDADSVLEGMAGVVGVPSEDILTCAEALTAETSERIPQVNTDFTLAQENGISGTPAMRIRYGTDALTVIEWEGQAYPSGGVPLEILAAIVMAANADAE